MALIERESGMVVTGRWEMGSCWSESTNFQLEDESVLWNQSQHGDYR